MTDSQFPNRVGLRVVLAAVLAVAPNVKGAASVSFFGSYVKNPYSQSGDSGAVAGTFFPYHFLTEVVGSELNSYGTASIAFPAGASFPTRQLAVSSSEESATAILQFNTQQDLDDATPNGTYTLSLGTQMASFDLSAGNSPNAPSILGGDWSGGKLQVTSAGYSLNFVTPTDTDRVRLYLYKRSGSFDTYRFEGDGTTTSFQLLASQLEEGVEYGAALDFINSVDTATAFGGAPGDIGYMARNEFTFVVGSAVPEPSSMVLGLGAFGILLLRRRR